MVNRDRRRRLVLRRLAGDGLTRERAYGAALRESLGKADLPTWAPELDCFWHGTPEANTRAALALITTSLDDTAVALLRTLSPGFVCEHDAEIRGQLPTGWPAARRDTFMAELQAGSSGEKAEAHTDNVVPLRPVKERSADDPD